MSFKIDPSVLQPHSLDAWLCEFCENIDISAYDAEGKTIMVASMDLTVAKFFRGQIDGAIEAVGKSTKAKTIVNERGRHE